MSQSEKARYYNELKEAGVSFSKHYREYNTAELKEAAEKLRAAQPAPEPAQVPEDYSWMPETAPPTATEPEPPSVLEAQAAAAQARAQAPQQPKAPDGRLTAAPQRTAPRVPQAPRNPDEMAGVRLNTHAQDEPIRVDENGLIWYQEEVRKPAYPKPRGRRVLQYMDSGVKEVTTKNGEYVETFEVAGDQPSRPSEVKITLPSYQVGIYKDPRFPFRIHIYNENRGFDLFEVQDYYGGSELVPPDVKRIYVENVLCYDIRTVVRDIQKQYRDLQLQGKA